MPVRVLVPVRVCLYLCTICVFIVHGYGYVCFNCMQRRMSLSLSAIQCMFVFVYLSVSICVQYVWPFQILQMIRWPLRGLKLGGGGYDATLFSALLKALSSPRSNGGHAVLINTAAPAMFHCLICKKNKSLNLFYFRRTRKLCLNALIKSGKMAIGLCVAVHPGLVKCL